MNGFALFSGTDYDNDTYIAGYSRNHCHSQVIDDLTRIELYMIIILSNLWPPKWYVQGEVSQQQQQKKILNGYINEQTQGSDSLNYFKV